MASKSDKQLLEAAQKGDVKGVETALAKGADINATDKKQFNNTALNYAAENGYLEITKLLVEKGADINHKGAADLTPLMNAALPSSPSAQHDKIVKFLINKGAIVSNDLLSSVQLKVNILTENAEAGMVRPEAVNAWKGFINYLYAAKDKQNLPKIMDLLSDKAAETRKNAAGSIMRIAFHGMDIFPAINALQKSLSDEDKDTRYYAAAALCLYYIGKKDAAGVDQLFSNKDADAKQGGIYAFVQTTKAGADISFAIKILTNLLKEKEAGIRHDAAITLGYAATNGINVSSAIPELVKLLSDEEPAIRENTAWTFYRIAKYIGEVSAAVPSLEKLLSDNDEKVKNMAAEALAMAKWRKEEMQKK